MNGPTASLPGSTLLLDRIQVASLLDLEGAIAAVEASFRDHALGRIPQPGLLWIEGVEGGVHGKAAFLPSPLPLIAVKLNANYPGNPGRGLPTIQGTIALFDGASGSPLAIMDSIEITILRTAAATAVAADHLAVPEADTVTLCGCGAQARAQLLAVAAVRPVRRAFLFDRVPERAERLASSLRRQGQEAVAVRELRSALRESLLVVTCTPSRHPFLGPGDLEPGTFVAAVGADSEEKQELDPRLVASATLVVDLVEPCAAIGELHHALEAGLMTRADVHAELGQVVAGLRAGRSTAEEVVVFDSTGTALQDAAAAGLVYQRAVAKKVGTRFDFSAKAAARDAGASRR